MKTIAHRWLGKLEAMAHSKDAKDLDYLYDIEDVLMAYHRQIDDLRKKYPKNRQWEERFDDADAGYVTAKKCIAQENHIRYRCAKMVVTTVVATFIWFNDEHDDFSPNGDGLNGMIAEMLGGQFR